jgi:Co/Zn/Cd efflux system component
MVSKMIVSKMDCPSEVRLVRLALEGEQSGEGLEFDIPNRSIKVFYQGSEEVIYSKLVPLKLGTNIVKTYQIQREEAPAFETERARSAKEARSLKALLIINAVMFIVELSAGWWAQSTGLIADSLDMFADAAVYSVALFAVGKSTHRKVRAAHISGYLQMLLGIGALCEVVRRSIFGSDPVPMLMMGFGLIALIANILCLWIISKDKDRGAHMKASWIFSVNDVIANLGLIIAGILVAVTKSPYPDLLVGFTISVVVLHGAYRILKLNRGQNS